MNASKILYDKAREFTKQADALRASAAVLDAKAATLNAAAREVDPWLASLPALSLCEAEIRPIKVPSTSCRFDCPHDTPHNR